MAIFHNSLRAFLHRAGKAFLFVGMFVLTMGFAVQMASAATINVTTFDDEFDNPSNGTCSLREAIKSANDGIAFGGCAKGDEDGTNPYSPGPDTIFLPFE